MARLAAEACRGGTFCHVSGLERRSERRPALAPGILLYKWRFRKTRSYSSKNSTTGTCSWLADSSGPIRRALAGIGHRPRSLLRRPQRRKAGFVRFLFIGRLLGGQGSARIWSARRLLKPSNPDWRFQLLGPIDEGTTAAASAPKRFSAGRSGFGRISRAIEGRPARDRQAAAIVLPSYREGIAADAARGCGEWRGR